MNRAHWVGILSFVWVFTLAASGCGDGTGDPAAQDAGQDMAQDTTPDMGPQGEQACSNGVDDDEDGLVDCADMDCRQADGCGPIIFGVDELSQGAIGTTPGGSLHSVDALCNSKANEIPGLRGGGWVAVFGNEVETTKERVGEVEGPVYNTANEVVVGADGNLFDPEASLQAPILDRDQQAFSSGTYMWTGSNADGTLPQGDAADTTCSGWTVSDSGSEGVAGNASSVDNWLAGPDGERARSCAQQLGLYCLSR